jgi:hypothetical protein
MRNKDDELLDLVKTTAHWAFRFAYVSVIGWLIGQWIDGYKRNPKQLVDEVGMVIIIGGFGALACGGLLLLMCLGIVSWSHL